MKKLLLLPFLLLFLAYSCGPSVEGESKQWKSNLNQLNKLSKEYPVFKSKIDAKVARAQKIFDQSSSISDEDKKAAKMHEANDLLNMGCVGNLKNSDSKIETVRSNVDKLRKIRMGMPEKDVRYSNFVIEDAERAITDLSKVLDKAKTAETAPCEELKTVLLILETSIDDLKQAITNLKRTKSDIEAEKKKNTVSNDNSKSNETTTKKATTVKCEYCGTKNDADRKKCSSCGAPL
ncbi:MAG: zinc finger Ran-binding domain-containing protein [Bacteroidota bacterium]|nr:zinc finger Ran-binding domain-containing protein [Bacteroidota bacterium]